MRPYRVKSHVYDPATATINMTVLFLDDNSQKHISLKLTDAQLKKWEEYPPSLFAEIEEQLAKA